MDVKTIINIATLGKTVLGFTTRKKEKGKKNKKKTKQKKALHIMTLMRLISHFSVAYIAAKSSNL